MLEGKMSLTITIKKISNDESSISIFVKNVWVNWSAKAIPVKAAGGTKSAYQRDVRADNLLITLLGKFCNVTDETTLSDAKDELLKALGDADFNECLQVDKWTRSLVFDMTYQKVYE